MHVLTEVDDDRIASLLARDEFFWIDLTTPSDEEVERLGRALGLHPVAVEDTLEFGQRPKIEPFDSHILVVFFTAQVTGDPDWPAEPLEIHLHVSGDFIATVRREVFQPLDDLHGILADEPSDEEELIVYRVLDTLTDAYFPLVGVVETEIDALEAAVLAHPRREQLRRSYRLKQCVRELHRRAAAQHEQFHTAHDVILALEGFTKGTRPYLRDIGDHLALLAGEFQRQLDDLLALTQTYFNANSERLNATATRITIGGTLFVVYTVVTGFFGQNFSWLVDNIDTRGDFLLFGVGALTVPTVILLTLFWVKRDDWF